MRAWSRSPLREPKIAVALLLVFVAVGLVQGGAIRLVRDDAGLDAWRPVAWHTTGAIGAWAALPCVVVALAWGRRLRWPRPVGVHVLGWIAFVTVHVAVMLGARAVAGAIVGVDLSATGSLAYQIGWEAQADVVLYAGLAALLGLLQAREDQRAAKLRAAQLEARVVEERLAALTARIDPHFLFNALNTVGAMMYEDLERTERLLASLGELLRAGLREGGPTWSLADELRHVEHYASICSARFETRVNIEVTVDDAIGATIVPRLAIQGLVENAIKHNRDLERPLTITVAARGDDELRVVVRDDGIGLREHLATDDADHGLGLGLARLREILALLHGDRASLRSTNLSTGGAEIELRIPREARA